MNFSTICYLFYKSIRVANENLVSILMASRIAIKFDSESIREKFTLFLRFILYFVCDRCT